MSSITIKEPIWRSESFGIADYRLEGKGDIIVKCSYIDTLTDELMYPHTYKMSKSRARRYDPIKMGRFIGREIPIEDFEIMNDE